jgi:hypothetical protein
MTIARAQDVAADVRGVHPEIERLFIEGRTFNTWQDRTLSDETLRQLCELAKYGPTSTNSSPLRVKFIRSADAKAALIEALTDGNKPKAASAPITAVLGMDMNFPATLPRLFAPRNSANLSFESRPDEGYSLSQFRAFRGVLYPCRAGLWLGLRSDERLRQGEDGCGLLEGLIDRDQFRLQSRLWKTRGSVSTQSTSQLRRGV